MSETTINTICGDCRHFSDGKCRNKREDVGFFAPTCDDYKDKSGEDVEAATQAASKICKGCGRELPLENFGKHNRTPDGRQNLCKDCMSARLKQGHRKDKDQKSEAPKPEAPKPAKPAPVELADLAPTDRLRQLSRRLASFTDYELFEELLSRGWTGILTRTETLQG